mmetsp:Transcript_23406/g.30387  ORF Transcript_23406/g.30387 Transcript_23406/m.30387 type:complete len:254 (+) Transcript_23406:90-851(+)|eukprot:CAMPEP_0197290776 /NCGR_PEP_ID=MMETSP0890-20130614/10126_1 /TAXON_ID=44058 ORGANISM="Aureoumbra lagunensis, Strain CCMP1510" /NCGR_SAMPLE_ID=MMETSP0890 /ASSEMBLY_ACC=CAM_ASM_000533 /LENGTH=253 /DNA_ID=CAMNT_0042763065 /DNA_START=102 /DNA_END=863 /DNA_ORIENTATION=+
MCGNFITSWIILATAAAAAEINLLTNGGFENGDDGSWDLTFLGANLLEITSYPSSPRGGGTPFPGASEGSYYAFVTQTFPGSSKLEQEFTVPLVVSSLILSFDHYTNDRSPSGVAPLNWPNFDFNGQPTQWTFVDILDGQENIIGGASQLGNMNQQNAFAWNPFSQDLLSELKSGETYKFRFGSVDNQGYCYHGIDNIRLLATVPDTGSDLLGLGEQCSSDTNCISNCCDFAQRRNLRSLLFGGTFGVCAENC